MDFTMVKSVIQRRSFFKDCCELTQMFKGCQIISFNPGSFINESKGDDGKTTDAVPSAELSGLQVSDSMFCNSCGLELHDRSHQVNHYRSDWHKFNLKRKLQGLSALSEGEFENLEDNQSNSSSDSESVSSSSTDEAENELPDKDSHPRSTSSKTPKLQLPHIFFRSEEGELFSVWRAALFTGKGWEYSTADITCLLEDTLVKAQWAFLMVAGGRFAGAIYNRGEITVHKTFHRYVVRAKGGTAQSSCDAQGNAPKSAGAAMRRHHEAALAEDIKSLLESWSEELKSCTRIFVRAVGSSRRLLFGGKQPAMSAKDSRVCRVPFSTRKCTLLELQRIQEQLSSVFCYGKNTLLAELLRKDVEHKVEPKNEGKLTVKAQQADCEVQPSEDKKMEDVMDSSEGTNTTNEPLNEPEPELVYVTESIATSDLQEFDSSPGNKPNKSKTKRVRNEPKKDPRKEGQKEDDAFHGFKCVLYGACQAGDVEDLLKIMDKIKALASVSLAAVLNLSVNAYDKTLLHVAAQEGQRAVVKLLLENGADPTNRDLAGTVPYVASTCKNVRNEFRRFMAREPDRYDYGKAQIPGPLTEEMEAAQRAKEAEKKKAIRKAKKDKQKEKKKEDVALRAEEEEKQRFMNLSDREKRALAAEKRLVEQWSSQGAAAPVLRRCFECGCDLSCKVPFEYSDNQFCSPACLKTHRFKPKHELPDNKSKR